MTEKSWESKLDKLKVCICTFDICESHATALTGDELKHLIRTLLSERDREWAEEMGNLNVYDWHFENQRCKDYPSCNAQWFDNANAIWRANRNAAVKKMMEK